MIYLENHLLISNYHGPFKSSLFNLSYRVFNMDWGHFRILDCDFVFPSFVYILIPKKTFHHSSETATQSILPKAAC